MDREVESWLDYWLHWLARRMDLFRGNMLRWRGAHVGWRFGLGRGARVLYPRCFYVGDNVTIRDYGYLHCLSALGVRIGNDSSIRRNLWLHCGGTLDNYDHGYVEIGDDTHIGCNAVIGAGGGIRIGSHVRIGQSVNFHAENHNFSDTTRLIKYQGVSYRGIVIEDDVWIGSKVTILDGVKVGQGAVIGAGAVVTESVPPYAVSVGVPAQVVKMRGR